MKPKSLQILVSKHGAAVEACFRELSSQSWALPIWFFGRSIVRSVAVVLASKSICYRCLASKCAPVPERASLLRNPAQCQKVRFFAVVVPRNAAPVPGNTIYCHCLGLEIALPL